MPFDQVRIIAVHDPHKIGKLSSAFGMQAPANVARFPLNLDGEVGEVRRDTVLEQAGFNSGGCLKHCLPITTVNNIIET